MAFIYKTTNKINGKVYIGKSKYNCLDYLGSGLKITAAVKKYGRDAFEKAVIEECDESILNDREIFWIDQYQSTDDKIGYNISKGGEGGAHYWNTLTDEEKIEHNKKISKGRDGQPRFPHSDKTKEKISATWAKIVEEDPDFYKKRADKKRKTYTCVNHDTSEMFITKNLKEFCKEHCLNFGSMQHNARTQKTFSNQYWSCRKGKSPGDLNTIIERLTNEVTCATITIRSKLTTAGKQKIRSKNSNAKKITFIHESGKVAEFNGNFYKESKLLTGYGYHTMKKLLDGRAKILHGWKLV